MLCDRSWTPVGLYDIAPSEMRAVKPTGLCSAFAPTGPSLRYLSLGMASRNVFALQMPFFHTIKACSQTKKVFSSRGFATRKLKRRILDLQRTRTTKTLEPADRGSARLLGWAVILIVATVVYDWLTHTSPGLTYTLTTAVFGAALFAASAWPCALLLAVMLVLRRTMALDLFA